MRSFAMLALAAAGIIASVPVFAASETGLAEALHDLRREGHKLCMSDHDHTGIGDGHTKREAEIAAMKAWEDFTAFEYGDAWGNFRLAGSQQMTCSGEGVSHHCVAVARPCKAGR